MTVLGPDECRCSCHDKPFGGVHVIACCDKCPKCGKNIVLDCFDRHVEKCEGANLVWELLKDSGKRVD